MRRLALHWKIIIGLVLGVVVGMALNELKPQLAAAAEGTPLLGTAFAFLTSLTDFVGKLFVRALRFIAVPIVLFSLIVGAASLGDLRKLGRIGAKTLGIYLTTTALAVTVGLVLANTIKPGSYISAEARDRLASGKSAEVAEEIARTVQVPGFWAQMLDLIPTNPFAAIAGGAMLQVIVTALLIGIGLTLIPREKSAPVIAFFDALTDVIVKLVHIVMWLAPYAVFALIVPVVAAMGLEVLKSLAIYAGTVLGGLALMLLCVYPVMTRVIGGVPYRRFFRAMAPAQLLAFSSSSSSATLPVTMECARERLGVDEEITSFVLPLGATVNMDGTALYQAVATIFISELYGFDLGLPQQITILLTAVLASIGTPGIPGAGVLMLIIILESVGIPPQAIAGGIAVILGVDRILDMCRTVINVSGDAATAVVVARTEGALRLPPE